MTGRRALRVAAITLIMGLVGCSDSSPIESAMPEVEPFQTLAELPQDALALLSEKTYFFGHQSVGVNIVDGLALVMDDRPGMGFDVELTDDASRVKPGTFLHSRIGKNREPDTKLRAFEQIMNNGMGDAVDAAFVKFCYLDGGSESNTTADKLFAEYQQSILALQQKYPGTRFVHFTMPLRTVPLGRKAQIMNFLGVDSSYSDNVKRGRFNALLRQAYLGKEPVFDIAHLESIARDTGKVSTFDFRGAAHAELARENTYDGAHLNEEGKRWVAEQLLIFLARLDYASS